MTTGIDERSWYARYEAARDGQGDRPAPPLRRQIGHLLFFASGQSGGTVRVPTSYGGVDLIWSEDTTGIYCTTDLYLPRARATDMPVALANVFILAIGGDFDCEAAWCDVGDEGAVRMRVVAHVPASVVRAWAKPGAGRR